MEGDPYAAMVTLPQRFVEPSAAVSPVASASSSFGAGKVVAVLGECGRWLEPSTGAGAGMPAVIKEHQ